MEADKISEDDLDEEAIKPFMDPDNIQARIDHIQCVDIVPCSKGKEEVAVHEEKDGNWGGGITLPDPGVYGPGTSEERPPGCPLEDSGEEAHRPQERHPRENWKTWHDAVRGTQL